MVARKTESLTCAVCGTALPPIALSSKQRIGRCPACGLGYTYPPPTPTPHLSREQPEYIPPPPRWRTQLKRVILRLSKGTLSPLMGITAPSHPTAYALDIGCGQGFYVRALRALGWNAFGLERYPALPMTVPTVFQADAHTLPVPSGTFQLVTCWHVLEHLAHPRTCLQEAYRVLRPGGLLLVEVPHMCSWQARVLKERWLHWAPTHHFWHFTAETLRGILVQAGFPRVRVFSMPNAPGWTDSLGLSRRWSHIWWLLDGFAALTGRGGVLRAWARK